METSDYKRITSTKNPQIQWIRELVTKRSSRDTNGKFIVEGIRLSEEVLGSGLKPDLILYSNRLSERGISQIRDTASDGVKIFEVSPEVLSSVSDTETSQGIMMVVSQKIKPLPDKADLVLIIDRVRDPGNLGTILRSAAATGVQAVLLSPGSVDVFSPKVVRAGMGAHFQICIQKMDWESMVVFCKNTISPPLDIFLADSGEGIPLWEIDLKKPLALIIGGEADGASETARSLTNGYLTIPMPGKFESLNAAVATSVILFETLRQRRK